MSNSKVKRQSSKAGSKEKVLEDEYLHEEVTMSTETYSLKKKNDNEDKNDSESNLFKKKKILLSDESSTHSSSLLQTTTDQRNFYTTGTISKPPTSTKVIGHTSRSSETSANTNKGSTHQYVTHFNPPMTPRSNTDHSSQAYTETSPKTLSDPSIRTTINKLLDKLFGMLETLPTGKDAKQKTFLEIDNTVISMSTIITRYKKNLSDDKTTKLPPAVTTKEKIVDGVIEDQGYLHHFNVEYKTYESAVINEQCAQARLKHAVSELNVSEAKMLHILKLINDKKIGIIVRET